MLRTFAKIKRLVIEQKKNPPLTESEIKFKEFVKNRANYPEW